MTETRNTVARIVCIPHSNAPHYARVRGAVLYVGIGLVHARC